ncbi:hypothetical protein, partial [Fulvivirga aurantia]|uniref:hypothetical protein n=1 Tax=Fulvivirga aurantia TaxID=2529383 RepID=UPI0016233A84
GNVIDSTRSDAQGKFNFKALPGDQQYFYTLGAEDSGIGANILITDATGNVVDQFSNEEKEQFFRYKQLGSDPNAGNYINADDATLSDLNFDSKNDDDLIKDIKYYMTYNEYEALERKAGQEGLGVNLRVQIGAYRTPSPDLFDDI